jgi:hypothetical protein
VLTIEGRRAVSVTGELSLKTLRLRVAETVLGAAGMLVSSRADGQAPIGEARLPRLDPFLHRLERLGPAGYPGSLMAEGTLQVCPKGGCTFLARSKTSSQGDEFE